MRRRDYYKLFIDVNNSVYAFLYLYPIVQQAFYIIEDYVIVFLFTCTGIQATPLQQFISLLDTYSAY